MAGFGAIIGLVIGVSLIVWTQLGGEPEVEAAPSPTSTVSVAEEDGPALPPDGYPQIPMHAQGDIPWDEIGPGWFLIAFDPADAGGYDFGQQRAGLDTLLLVDPDGNAYPAASLEGLGVDEVEGWFGDYVLATHTTEIGIEFAEGDLLRIDVEAASVADTYVGAGYPGILSAGAGGTAVTVEGAEAEWGIYSRLVPEMAGRVALCGNVFGGLRSSLSPDGTRVVCFEAAGERTGVVLGTVGLGSDPVQTFSRAAGEYAIHGWLDADRLLFSRWGEDARVYFTVHVTVGDTLEQAVPVSPSTGTLSVSPRTGFVNVTSRSEVAFWDADGVPVATVPCAYRCEVLFSGEHALVVDLSRGSYPDGQDPQDATVTLVDTQTGVVVEVVSATFDAGAIVKAFPHPEDYH